MNLIEQQNILRGLADDALKNEMGGNVPPYLVLAEVNRRKSARERYEAANAKYRANQPTVAEELMGQMPQAGIDTALTGGGMRAPGPMAMPAGIDAAMPQQQPQAFANGGVVGYEGGGIVDLVKAYNARLSSTDADRQNAESMALMNIGAQIMAGRSRNTLSNVGSGLSAALPSYQQSMERLNTQEMQGLRDQIDLARQMQQEDPAFKLAQRRKELIDSGFDPEDPNFKYYLSGMSPPATAKPMRMTRISGYDAAGNTVTGWVDPTDPSAVQWNVPAGVDPSTIREKSPEEQAADTAEARADVQISAKLEASKPKDAAALREAEMKLQEAVKAIEDVKSGANFFTTGLVGAVTSGVPSLPAYEQFSAIRTLKANQALGALAAIRATSPTGGALGTVSDADMKLLESDVTAIEGALGEKELKERLDTFETHLRNALGNRQQLYRDTYGEDPPSFTPAEISTGAEGGTTTTDIPWSR